MHQPLQTDLIGHVWLLCHGGAGDHVAVAADILGAAVNHNVHAEIQRIGQIGRGEGVVADGHQSVLFGNGHNAGDVRDFHSGVGGGFKIDQLGIGTDAASTAARSEVSTAVISTPNLARAEWIR